MEDHMKTLAGWAGVGAALGLGVVLGMSLRTLALGALIGVGAGAAMGVAGEVAHRRPRGMVPPAEQPALH